MCLIGTRSIGAPCSKTSECLFGEFCAEPGICLGFSFGGKMFCDDLGYLSQDVAGVGSLAQTSDQIFYFTKDNNLYFVSPKVDPGKRIYVSNSGFLTTNASDAKFQNLQYLKEIGGLVVYLDQNLNKLLYYSSADSSIVTPSTPEAILPLICIFST
jgi:hypothetical protein